MYLLNADQIRYAVRELPRGQRLDIGFFNEANLQHTSYYFRLGAHYYRWSEQRQQYLAAGVLSDVDADAFLEFAPREYVRVRSYESFRLDARTLGVLGSVSDLADLGIHLIHSPFIDPLFPSDNGEGHLKLGLLNLRDGPAALRFKDLVGKVSFFDTSDTYPVQLVPGSSSERKFRER